MERSTRVFSLLLLMLLIAMSSEIGMTKVGEARTCESQSKRFKGLCVSRTNCANVCKTEGFPGGHCRGLRRRCFCLTHCT